MFDLGNGKKVETALLAAMIIEPDEVLTAVVATGVAPSAWSVSENSQMAQKVFDQLKDTGSFDELIFLDDIADNEELTLYYSDMQSCIDTVSGWERWLDRFLEHYKEKRSKKAIETAELIINERGSDEAFKHLTEERSAVLEIRDSLNRNNESKEIDDAIAEMRMMIAGKVPPSRCTFPIPVMNSTFRAPQDHEMITIAARTGVGKTVMACQLAGFNMQEGKRGAYISVEMPFDQLSKRIAGQMAEVNLWHLDRELHSKQEEVMKLMNRIKLTKNTGKFCPIRTTSLEVAELKLKRWMESYGEFDYIILDYIQAMRTDMSKKSDTKATEIGRVSKRVKEWTAKEEFGCTVFTFAQLNREVVKDGIEPQLHHLKACGELEEDSDRVIMIHCPTEWEGQPQEDLPLKTYLLLQRKMRNGPTAKVRCEFFTYWAKLKEKR